MDPQATWEQLLEALSSGDHEQVEELATELLRWLERGGFPPRAVLGTDLGPTWDRAATRFACAFALTVATKLALTATRRTLMRVDRQDGCCRSCGSELRIVEADDATMTVECTDPSCADSYAVEHDAFGDGAMMYVIQFLSERQEVDADG